MEATGWIGLWGGVVSTGLAIIRFTEWRLDRPRLVVDSRLIFDGPGPEDGDGVQLGTPVTVQLERDTVDRLAHVGVTIANHGNNTIQVAAVVVEFLAKDAVSVFNILPDPLPAVIDPRTSLTLQIQKEFFDTSDNISFSEWLTR